MKNLWFNRFLGNVTVKVSGKGIERFINVLIRDKILIWNVKRLGTNAIAFQLLAKDVPMIQEYVEEFEIELTILGKSGFPFFLQRLKRNSGFVVGVFLAMAIILLLSNMIWKVQIEGASPDLEYKLTNQLKSLGIRPGGLKFFVDDPQSLQKKITQLNEEITWIGVEVQGTSYTFQVVEKERPEKEKATPPRHLVANKEAIIVDYFVEKGEPVVSIHDFVRPGQILVSGLIGKEDEPQLVSAKGKVWGKTWYKTTISIKMHSEIPKLTGEKMVKRSIEIGNFSIPIWGFKNEQYKNKQVERNEQTIKLLRWTFPVSFVKTTIWEVQNDTVVYSEDQARDLAKDAAEKDLKNILPQDAQITGEKVLHEQVENGTFKLSILYDVVENIAIEQPIIQQN